MAQHKKLKRKDYEPKFDRLSTERRVLGFITDEKEIGVGPRNTLEALDHELAADPNTDYTGTRTELVERGDEPDDDVYESVKDTSELSGYLTALFNAGLIKQRADQSYKLTPAGLKELVN